MKELEIPNIKELVNDEEAIELIRFWISSGDCHVNLNIGIWANDGNDVEKELLVWSNMLSDISQHVANAVNKRYGFDASLAKRLMAKEFNKCIKSSTPGLQGE